jgi:chromate transporter
MEQELVIKSEQEILPISFWQAFLFWLKLGFISFGGQQDKLLSCTKNLLNKNAGFLKNVFYML